MTPGVRVHVVMPPGLLERVDAARGEGQSRGDFVRRAVERALSEAVVDAKLREALAPAAEAMLGSPLPEGSVVVPVFRRGSGPAPAEQPERRVPPSGPASPRVPFRRDVKPFQRGGS